MSAMTPESSLLLRTFTTMKIGGSADKILKLKDLQDLSGEKLPQPVRILGNGSNILIDDQNLSGTVVIVRDFPPHDPEILSETPHSVWIRASAGVFLPTLARWSSRRGFSGCEYMIGVPGTLGGALVQNAGANDQDLSMILKSALVFDLETNELREWSASECALSYRHSRLKEVVNQLVVSVVLELAKKSALECEKRVDLNLIYRKEKTPYSKPSLGSIFTRQKNAQTGEWIFAGKLIEEAGLKGYQIGGAQVSPVHANYIVNEAHATFDDVLALIEHIETIVEDHSGIKLEREVVIWSDRT